MPVTSIHQKAVRTCLEGHVRALVELGMIPGSTDPLTADVLALARSQPGRTVVFCSTEEGRPRCSWSAQITFLRWHAERGVRIEVSSTEIKYLQPEMKLKRKDRPNGQRVWTGRWLAVGIENQLGVLQ